jgi:hypothetical protein
MHRAALLAPVERMARLELATSTVRHGVALLAPVERYSRRWSG